MESLITAELVAEMERSEAAYMADRMEAIRGRPGNPEGVDLLRFGQGIALYSETMPWPAFNAVKGLRDSDDLDAILLFYEEKGRSPFFEIVPSTVGSDTLGRLAERGYYQSQFHATTYADLLQGPVHAETDEPGIEIRVLEAEEFELYARIHCRGTGLPDDGIPPVAANNRVLYDRPGWRFYVASLNGEPASAAVMHLSGQTASFTFAATLPAYRGRGLHRALLRKRLTEAAECGCTLAVAQCAFLSQSHRNMERAGMKLGYVRTTWRKL